MTEERRQMLLTVIDNDFRLVPYAHQFEGYKRCDDMLKWCIANRKIGKELYAFIAGDCKGSVLTAVSNILARKDKERKAIPIFRKDLY